MENNIKLIIFDFDGTIADSLLKGIEITNKIAKQLNIKTIKEEEIEHLRNLTPYELIKYMGIPLFKIPVLVARYHKETNEIIDTLKPYHGMPGVINTLAEKYMLGILSSNSEENINKFLKNNNLDKNFLFVSSQPSLFGKGASLKKIMRQHKLGPDQVIYIGDEVRDIQSAKKARIKIISVTWGGNSRKLLERFSPDYIAETPGDILSILT